MDFWSNINIATDIQNYVRVIKKHNVDCLFNVDILQGIAETLPDVDYCDIDDIEIDFYNRQPISQTRPKIKSFKISLINSISSIPDVDLSIQDPIKECSFDLVLTGFCAFEEKEFINCWHLDKDIREEGDNEHKYTHPLYHFQFGGRHMNDIETSGDILLMGAPRIPHPPMDIFLAIHFVLNNYFNKKEDDFSCLIDLYEDTDYQDILENAKERMWYPYFNGLKRSIGNNSDLTLANLFPLAV